MPGARFQNAARVRNSYPWQVSYGARVDMSITSVAADNEVSFLYPATVRMPFDVGPDKAPFVGVTIHDVHIIARANVYAPTAPILSGAFYYRGVDGQKVYLATIHETLVAPGAVVDMPTVITLPPYIAQENVSQVGSYGFENLASAFGSSSTFTIMNYVNVGLYPVYAEEDWTQTICDAIREVNTPQWVKDGHPKSEPYQKW